MIKYLSDLTFRFYCSILVLETGVQTGGANLFKVGDKVVYPMHGAGIIDGVETKEILGEEKEYYVLRLPLKNMKVMLPTENVNFLGVRDVITNADVEAVLTVLSTGLSNMPSNWNRRYRANMEKVKSGDVLEVAGVVRDLLIMEHQKGLSTGERKMLMTTKQILVSELVLATGQNEKEIEKIISNRIF